MSIRTPPITQIKDLLWAPGTLLLCNKPHQRLRHDPTEREQQDLPLLFLSLVCLFGRGARNRRCKYRAAPGTATTGNRSILLSGHKVEREAVYRNPSQQVGAAWREPRRGEIPVELAAASRLMTSHSKSGCRGQMDLHENIRSDGGTGQRNMNFVYGSPTLILFCRLASTYANSA